MGTPAAARKARHRGRKNAKGTHLRVVGTPKKRVKERPAAGKRFEVEHFGRPPKGATHLQMRRVHPNGTTEKLLLNEGGFEIDKFRLERVSADWIRRTWGAGQFRGNWFAQVDGAWKPMGQMQSLRLATSTGSEARSESRSKPLRTVGYPFAVPPVAVELEPEERRAIESARVRAEREIAELRIRTMAELEKIRTQGMREEHERDMRRLERRIEELSRRSEEEEDDEDEEPEPMGPPGPWDFLRPLMEQAAPLLQQAIPVWLAKLTGNALPESTQKG